ncbi:MAG: lasso peptide biosynthesis B2 protein [Pseudomonadota bacterium]
MERAALARALCLLPLVSCSLKAVSLRRVQQWIGIGAALPVAHVETGPVRVELRERAQRVARMVDLAARRGLGRHACLARSLVLCHLLARIGLDARLKLGVAAAQPGQIDAHAWVELDGQALDPVADPQRRHLAFE